MTKLLPLFFLLATLSSCNKAATDGTTDNSSNCPSMAQTDGTGATTCTTPPVETDPGTGVPVDGGDDTSGNDGSDDDSSNNGGSTETPSDVPAEALIWDANIYMVNFSASQEAKVNTAVTLVKKVIASSEFRDRVLNYTYNGKKQFVDNGGKTNAQVYQMILDGAETLNGNKNNTMDVELELYYSLTSTIGYTYPNSERIWMNTKYFDNYTPVQVADNLTHEWVHKLGFDHASSWSESRDHSVPYAIGYLIEELAAKYYNK